MLVPRSPAVYDLQIHTRCVESGRLFLCRCHHAQNGTQALSPHPSGLHGRHDEPTGHLHQRQPASTNKQLPCFSNAGVQHGRTTSLPGAHILGGPKRPSLTFTCFSRLNLPCSSFSIDSYLHPVHRHSRKLEQLPVARPGLGGGKLAEYARHQPCDTHATQLQYPKSMSTSLKLSSSAPA